MQMNTDNLKQIILRERITVPATDFDDIKVFALNLDNPKSHT